MTTALHSERMDAVLAALRACGAATIADLGCGEGPLLLRLAQDPAVERVLGLDCCLEALETLRDRLRDLPAEIRDKVELVHGSMMEGGGKLAGFDAAILVETIEHLEPDSLSMLERAVFRGMRPAVVIVSTPNREFNGLLGVPPHRHRHPDHRFEWDRARFRRWASGVATRNGYRASCDDIAGRHPALGGASQMAVFVRQPPARPTGQPPDRPGEHLDPFAVVARCSGSACPEACREPVSVGAAIRRDHTGPHVPNPPPSPGPGSRPKRLWPAISLPLRGMPGQAGRDGVLSAGGGISPRHGRSGPACATPPATREIRVRPVCRPLPRSLHRASAICLPAR